jgi:hypothetical protein
MLLHQRYYFLQNLGLGNNSAAALASEYAYRGAPCALPRDAPVGAGLYHAVYPLLAPRGDPCGLVHFFEASFTQALVLHGYEPLLRCPENHGLLASPAVGIGMGQAFLEEKRVFFFKYLNDGSVGLENELSFYLIDASSFELPVLVDGGIDVKALPEGRNPRRLPSKSGR